MPVLLNLPPLPIPPTPPPASAENRSEATAGDAGFAQALRTASGPHQPDKSSARSENTEKDKTTATADPDGDAAAAAALWHFPMPADFRRSFPLPDAPGSLLGDRLAVARLGNRSSELPTSGTALDAAAAAGASETSQSAFIVLPATSEADVPELPTLPASAGITDGPRARITTSPATAGGSALRDGPSAVLADALGKAPISTPGEEGSEPTIDRIARRGQKDDALAATLAAARSARDGLAGTSTSSRSLGESARNARLIADLRGQRQEVANPSTLGLPASDFGIGTAKAQDSALAVLAPEKSFAGSNDPSIATTLAPLNHASRPETIAVTERFASAQWTSEVATKLAQVIVMRQDQVELRLNPPELGPVDVRVHMTGDQATVLIAAPHAVTRDALEQALPQLRDALAHQGITLGQATVQGEGRSHDAPAHPSARSTESDPTNPLAAAATPHRPPRADRLIDTFA